MSGEIRERDFLLKQMARSKNEQKTAGIAEILLEKIDKSRGKLGFEETARLWELEGWLLEKALRRHQIDLQWDAAKPQSMSEKMHSGERKMLYSVLADGETVESIVGGTFRQDTDRLHKHNGVAVATSTRVVFLDKGILGSTETMQIAYRNVEAVTFSTGMFAAGIQVAGRGTSSFRIEDVADKESVKRFADCVQAHIDTAQQPIPPPATPSSSLDELERLAGLVERGFVTREEFEVKKKEILGI